MPLGASPEGGGDYATFYGDILGWTACLLVCSLALVLALAAHWRVRPLSLLPLLTLYLGVADFIGDAAFIAVIPTASPALRATRDLAAAFLVCSAASNILLLLAFFRTILRGSEKNAPFVRWLRKHQGTFWGVLALRCGRAGGRAGGRDGRAGRVGGAGRRAGG